MKKIQYDESKCVGCFSCVLVCPIGVIESTEDKKISIDYERCVECQSCVDCCPRCALSYE